ncbi:MAG: GNAT family N-acetyltransferase [Terriglobales bacterium]
MLRKAVSQDLPGVLRCLHEAFEPYRKDYTPAAFLDTVLTPGTLQTRFHGMSIFVAADLDGEIIGTIACNRPSVDERHIRGMAVLPAWHGHDIAQNLLNAAEAELRTSDCRRVTLDTTKPLERAIAFYLRNKFRATGVVTDFFGMPLYEYEKDL